MTSLGSETRARAERSRVLEERERCMVFIAQSSVARSPWNCNPRSFIQSPIASTTQDIYPCRSLGISCRRVVCNVYLDTFENAKMDDHSR